MPVALYLQQIVADDQRPAARAQIQHASGFELFSATGADQIGGLSHTSVMVPVAY
jgi:hypothetical protein